MKRPRMQLVVLVLALLLCALMLAPNYTSPARADDPPVATVHFTHSPAWYQQNRTKLPLGPTNNMTYHGGSVMQTVKAYTIFWQPSGSSAFPTGYQTLINRYFGDVGDTAFYNINTQYYQSPPQVNMRNVSTLGGTWLDTTNAYPHTGTAGDPLLNVDIKAEVTRAITANSWPNGGLTNHYFVFTTQGIESCFTTVSSSSPCTLGVNPTTGYCAYHTYFNFTTIFSNMPFGETWDVNCRAFSVSPNGNLAADAEISTTSHEHFEAATDPQLTAWYDTDLGGEIGDKCAYQYLTVAGDGSNVTLNGNEYIVQSEWSNATFTGAADSGCTLSFPFNIFLPSLFR